MSEKLKNIVVSVLFMSIIIGVLFLNLIVKDSEMSYSERRKLKQFPKITMKSILDKTNPLSDQLEDYAMDQFILRDKFRSLKTIVKLNVLFQKDNNDLFTIDNKIYKMLYPLSEKDVTNFTDKINNVYSKYLEGNPNVYYTIVPDKNYYLNDTVYLKIDYSKLLDMVQNNVNSQIKYIDITDTLNADSYYDTDTHWKQEKIIPTVQKIAQNMNIQDRMSYNYEEKEYGEFYGTYYGQLGKLLKPDTINYLTNRTIENAKTRNFETKKESLVYDSEKADKSLDKYDLFLSGATPIIVVENKEAKTDKELVIFRDSFGSSIAPLFIEAYSKVTLVDIRYVPTEMVSEYLSFDNQDVLFLYSTLLVNESGALK